jgi:hypothetical protein
MIWYSKNTYLGLSLMKRLYGSAVLKPMPPALLIAGISYALEEHQESAAFIGDMYDHPYPYQIFAFLVGFCLIFRTNFAYQRYQEALGHVVTAGSKWGDAAMHMITWDTSHIHDYAAAGPYSRSANDAGSGKGMIDQQHRKQFRQDMMHLFSLLHAVAMQELRRDTQLGNLKKESGEAETTDLEMTQEKQREEQVLKKRQMQEAQHQLSLSMQKDNRDSLRVRKTGSLATIESTTRIAREMAAMGRKLAAERRAQEAAALNSGAHGTLEGARERERAAKLRRGYSHKPTVMRQLDTPEGGEGDEEWGEDGQEAPGKNRRDSFQRSHTLGTHSGSHVKKELEQLQGHHRKVTWGEVVGDHDEHYGSKGKTERSRLVAEGLAGTGGIDTEADLEIDMADLDTAAHSKKKTGTSRPTLQPTILQTDHFFAPPGQTPRLSDSLEQETQEGRGNEGMDNQGGNKGRGRRGQVEGKEGQEENSGGRRGVSDLEKEMRDEEEEEEEEKEEEEKEEEEQEEEEEDLCDYRINSSFKAEDDDTTAVLVDARQSYICIPPMVKTFHDFTQVRRLVHLSTLIRNR